MSRGKFFISEVLLVILVGMCFGGSLSHPAVSYREPGPNKPAEILTTTPKKIKDSFQLNKQVVPIPQNGSKKPLPFMKPHFVSKVNNEDMGFEPVTYKLKTAKLADKTLKQSEDDDDDDDGGEYDGVADDGNCKKKDQQEDSQEKKSMPMMIIRGFDVMAMDIPVPNGKKLCKKPHDERKPEVSETNNEDQDDTMDLGATEKDTYQTERNLCQPETTPRNGCSHKGDSLKDRDSGEPKDPRDPTDKYRHTNWGEWSPCSKSCGEGVQTRSRMKPSGLPDTQFRSCHLADCRAEPRYEAARVVPSQYGFREMLQN